MIEILGRCMLVLAQFITGIYNIELEYTTGQYVKFGNIMLGFACFFVALYYIFRALGIYNNNDE